VLQLARNLVGKQCDGNLSAGSIADIKWENSQPTLEAEGFYAALG